MVYVCYNDDSDDTENASLFVDSHHFMNFLSSLAFVLLWINNCSQAQMACFIDPVH